MKASIISFVAAGRLVRDVQSSVAPANVRDFVSFYEKRSIHTMMEFYLEYSDMVRFQ